MIQAIGLTSVHRRRHRPAVDDLTFEARPGRVTVLLGPQGAGKTTALRLMLQLRPGRGVALFRGRPVHRIQHLAREVGTLLGDVPGHPARTARGHLRMLSAVAGVQPGRADEVLDVVGLSGLADQRLGLFSLGMDRRLGVAAALLGDPHTFLLDEPAQGLSPREKAWLYGMLRGYAEQGGSVLFTSRDTREATRLADRVVSIDAGRLVADQHVTDFARTRLRPRVAVHTPYAERLAGVLLQESRTADADPSARSRRTPLEVVQEEGNRLSVYGSSCAEVGEYAYRNGILVHQLADEYGESGDSHQATELLRADGRHSSEATGLTPTASAVPGPDIGRASVPTVFSDSDGSDNSPTIPLPPIVTSPSHTGSSEQAAVVSLADDSGTADLGHADVESSPDQEDSVPPAPRSHPRDGSETLASPPFAMSQQEAGPSTNIRGAVDVRSSADGDLNERPDGELASDPTPLTGVYAPAADDTQSDRGPTSDKAPDGPHGGSESFFQPAWMPSRPSARATALPPPLPAIARPGPVAPLRYELRRLFGVRTTWLTLAAAALAALVLGLVSVGTGNGLPQRSDSVLGGAARVLTGWPEGRALVLSPAAFAAGVLGALSFGQEFRYPALAPARTSVPRRLGLLAAKLTVSAAVALALCLGIAGLNAASVSLALGPDVLTEGPSGTDFQVQAMAVSVFTVGCAWVGVLAAGICRSTLAGTAVVLAVPLVIAPAVRGLLAGPADRSLDGLPKRLDAVLVVPWPAGADHLLSVVLRLVSQPIGCAVALCLCVLLCLYLCTSLRGRVR